MKDPLGACTSRHRADGTLGNAATAPAAAGQPRATRPQVVSEGTTGRNASTQNSVSTPPCGAETGGQRRCKPQRPTGLGPEATVPEGVLPSPGQKGHFGHFAVCAPAPACSPNAGLGAAGRGFADVREVPNQLIFS